MGGAVGGKGDTLFILEQHSVSPTVIPNQHNHDCEAVHSCRVSRQQPTHTITHDHSEDLVSTQALPWDMLPDLDPSLPRSLLQRAPGRLPFRLFRVLKHNCGGLQ